MDEILAAVQKSKNGDEQAFSRLYDEFADRLFRYIKSKINSQQQAEDILQETFVKAWQHLNQFDIGRPEANFNAWLYKIATNTIYDYFRKTYRQPPGLELNEAIETPSGQDLQAEVADRMETQTVQRALELLPAHYRAVVELRFVQGFSVNETAKILGRSGTATRILQFRALKSVRKILNNNDDFQYSKI